MPAACLGRARALRYHGRGEGNPPVAGKDSMRRCAALLLLLICCPRASWAAERRPLPELFDPARHMRVSEIKPGMTGYGLSVFKGTKIERFDVEVLSVLRDFNPQCDVILVSLKGANLEHTGSIAGMSGSPIFLKDDEGRERMVGAFAYGWPLMKDPVGGVQPIEYMLKLKQVKPATRPATTREAEPSGEPGITKLGSTGTSAGPIHWDLSDVVLLPGMKEAPATYPLAGINSFAPNPRLGVPDDANVTRLRPLATPLMTS